MTSKRLSAEKRRSQIASVAARLFAKRGFSGVTTREIARCARISEAILFRHFPTKKALYSEIIDKKIHVKPKPFDLEAAKKEDDVEVFCSIADYFLKETEKDNTLLRLMLYSALEDHELASVFINERIDVLFDSLLDYVQIRIKKGAFKNVKPAVIVRAFTGMFFHFIIAHELFHTPKKLNVSKNEAIENFVDIFLNGIRK